jgi:hypothetical protein
VIFVTTLAYWYFGGIFQMRFMLYYTQIHIYCQQIQLAAEVTALLAEKPNQLSPIGLLYGKE